MIVLIVVVIHIFEPIILRLPRTLRTAFSYRLWAVVRGDNLTIGLFFFSERFQILFARRVTLLIVADEWVCCNRLSK